MMVTKRKYGTRVQEGSINKNLFLKEFPRFNQKNHIYCFLEEYDERAKKVRTAASSYTIHF